jgi:hypothetical protein
VVSGMHSYDALGCGRGVIRNCIGKGQRVK